jgi:hypothetical protein
LFESPSALICAAKHRHSGLRHGAGDQGQHQIHQSLGHEEGIELRTGPEHTCDHDIAEEAQNRRQRGQSGDRALPPGLSPSGLHA